jgi:hypothetical protein
MIEILKHINNIILEIQKHKILCLKMIINQNGMLTNYFHFYYLPLHL